MRVAPVGLVRGDPFELGCRIAAITHGHRTGQVASGAFAAMIAAAMAGATVNDAVDQGRSAAASSPDAKESITAVDLAMALAGEPVTPETLERVGAGWIAEEALAVTVWCVLVEPDLERALLLAVNHSGDTGSLVGQLLGSIHGEDALPERWRTHVELADVITDVAEQLLGAESSR